MGNLNKKSTYLGDGLYATDDGFMIELSCERENGKHWVGLEDEVLSSLIRFLEKSRDVKITIEKNP